LLFSLFRPTLPPPPVQPTDQPCTQSYGVFLAAPGAHLPQPPVSFSYIGLPSYSPPIQTLDYIATLILPPPPLVSLFSSVILSPFPFFRPGHDLRTTKRGPPFTTNKSPPFCPTFKAPFPSVSQYLLEFSFRPCSSPHFPLNLSFFNPKNQTTRLLSSVFYDMHRGSFNLFF